jgi:exopolysaccharide biosynthesis protein
MEVNVTSKRYKTKGNKPRKSIFKRLLIFFIFQFLFTAVTLPVLIFYGPFETVKGSVIGMTWNSSKFRFVPKLFLSDVAIRRVLKSNSAIDPTKGKTQPLKMLNFKDVPTDKVEVYDVKGTGFNGKMMIVYNPKDIEVGYSEEMPKSGETTSTIAKRANAVAAINAGGFLDKGWTGTGGAPMGFIIHKGEVVYNQQGSETVRQNTVAFTDTGMLIVGKHSIKSLKDYHVKEAVSFGPPLVVNGKPTIAQGDGGWGIAPRTAIGQRENGEVLMLVIDGRSLNSLGASLKDVQDIFIKYGAVNAVNMDGGSSATMYYNGKVINKPSDVLGERAVSSVFMVSPK